MEDSKKVKPLGDRVWVKAGQEDVKKTASGIILGEHAAHGKKVFGTVVSVGQGLYTNNGHLIPMEVVPGDEVMYHHGHGDKIEIGDEEYLQFKEQELIAVVR
jgi:chaperonin GroES